MLLFGKWKRRRACLMRRTIRRFRCFQHVILRNRSAFSTVYLLKAAKSDGVSDHYIVQYDGIGVRFRLFACSKQRNPMSFPTITLFNMAESECVFDRLLIKGCEIEWRFRHLLFAMRRMGNEKRRRRWSNHRFRSRETWQCDCYAGFSDGVSAVFVLIRRLIYSLCCRL